MKNTCSFRSLRGIIFSMILSITSIIEAQDTLQHATGVLPPMQAGAVTVLESRDFNQGMIHHPLQLVQGRVSGLMVSRPGGDPNGYFQSRMRGLHTFGEGYAEPLIVVDGLPQASLLTLDPANIASITVLRDASSCARYGLRGAAGVILIQTRGVQEPGLQLRYRAALALEIIAQRPPMLDAGEFRNVYSAPNSPFFRPDADLGASTNWIKEITRTGLSHWHQVEIGHGGKKGDYRFALHFRDTDGMVRNSGYTQFNGHFSTQQRLWKDRIHVGADLNYTRRKAQHVIPDVHRLATVFNPTMPVRSNNATSIGGYAQLQFFSLANPVALIEQIVNEGQEDVATANVHGKWYIAEGFRLNGRYAVQQYDGLRGFAAPKDEYAFGLTNGGLAQRYTDKTLNEYGEATLEYQLPFGKSQVLFSGGYHWQHLRFETERITGNKFLASNFSYTDLDTKSLYETAVETKSKDAHQLNSFRAQAELQAGNLYASAMLRREGSSRLGKNNKWAWLPAVQAAYDLRAWFNAENWDALRLRSSYAWVGNAPQRSFLSLLTYQSGQTFFYDSTFIPSQIPLHYSNPDLKREIRKEWNIGFDWATADRRFFLSADYYRSRSSDLIRQVFQNIQIGGVGNIRVNRYANVADLTHTGLELQAGGTIVAHSNFSWVLSSNIWSNRSTMGRLTLPPYDSDLNTEYGFFGFTANNFLFRLTEDSELGEMWAPVFERINEAGQWELKDSNGNGVPDYASAGSALPSWGLGISSRMEWGRFDLNIFLRGLFGHAKVDPIQFITSSKSTRPGYNINADALEAPLNRLQQVPFFSDFFIHQASFLRLDNMVLGYTLPTQQGKRISGWRFYLAGQNLFTLGGRLFSDPEPYLAAPEGLFQLNPGISQTRYGIPAMNAIQPGPGLQTGTYFQGRTLVLGVEARF